MSVAWNPKRLWNFCLAEVETEEIELIFTSNLFSYIQSIKIKNFAAEKYSKTYMVKKSL